MAKGTNKGVKLSPDTIEPDKRSSVYVLDISPDGSIITLYNASVDQVIKVSTVQFLLARNNGLTIDNSSVGIVIESGKHYQYFIKKVLTRDKMLVAKINDPSAERVVTRFNQPSGKFVNGTNYRFLVTNVASQYAGVVAPKYSFKADEEGFKGLFGGPNRSAGSIEFTYMVPSGYSYAEAKSELEANSVMEGTEFGGEEMFGDVSDVSNLKLLSGSYLLEQRVDSNTFIPPTYETLEGVNFLTLKDVTLGELELPESLLGITFTGTVFIEKLDMRKCGIRDLTLFALSPKGCQIVIKELFLPETAISFRVDTLSVPVYASSSTLNIGILHIPNTLRLVHSTNSDGIRLDLMLLEEGYGFQTVGSRLSKVFRTCLVFMENDPEWEQAYKAMMSGDLQYISSLDTEIELSSPTYEMYEPEIIKESAYTGPSLPSIALMPVYKKTSAGERERISTKQKVYYLSDGTKIYL